MRANDGIWRALAAARGANLAADGLPPPIPGQWGTTRRALLKALGAGGIAALLPAARADVGRVAILGGGLAGLSALHHLREAGIDARLYEARPRLGGRVHTVTHGGATFERGGQLVNSDHADIRRLASRLGVALIDRKDDAHRTMVVHDGRAIAPEQLADALRPIARQIDADASLLESDIATHAPRFDRLSIRDYLDRHAALMTAPWVRALLEGTARTEYGVEPARASALELLFTLPVVDGARVEVLGGSDERYVIAGGSSALVAALAARHRDRIVTGRAATRIARGRGGLRVGFRDGASAAAERVIVAVPAPLARAIDYAVPLPPRWRAFLGQMELGRNEKWQWAMATTPWRQTLGSGGEAWGADARGAAALAWEGSVRRSGPPVWTWFFGGDQVRDALASPAVLAAAFAGVAPGLDAARFAGGVADRSFWHADPLTRGSYVNYPPGQLTRFAELLWVEPDGAAHPAASSGAVVFAGEHLSDAFPGYMNGAAQTGRLAAESIVGRALV